MQNQNKNHNILSILLLGLLVLSGIFNIVFISIINEYSSVGWERIHGELIVATSSGPATLEPVDSSEISPGNVLDQVIETLFAYNLRDLNLPRINLLAESYHWENKTTLNIKLREGILFHDYTPFNASAAKWNLDRLQYLINATGMNTGNVAHTQFLWMQSDGITPIINDIKTVSEYNITITLTSPYGPFLNTLTLINAGMISPSFHATQNETFIQISEDICGTGPFKYDGYTPDSEVRMSRWDNYWMQDVYGNPLLANFRYLIYEICDNSLSAHNLFLANYIDINLIYEPQNIATYETNARIRVYKFTEETNIPDLVYYYLGINNKKYNRTWRKAISHAINYTYIIEVLQQGDVSRAKSPISPGFGFSYNESLNARSFNITKARETMVSMGFGDMSWNDSQWINIAEPGTSFNIVKYTYNIGDLFRENLGIAIFEWFKLIGIAVENEGIGLSEFLNYLLDDKDHLDLFMVGWSPDYLEPFNILDPLFNPTSTFNIAQVNDTHLNDLLALSLEATNDDARNIIYKNIQAYITEAYFHIPLYHNKITYVHWGFLGGYPYNALKKFQAYSIFKIC
jgi:peptide/nickel transport system substrate-binding protein